MARARKKILREAGWREWIAFPELGIPRMKAKLDTGARTSALHAVDIEEYIKDGVRWAGFRIPGASIAKSTRCSARILDERNIKNTSGQAELRYIVETALVFGKRRWRIELSLANRRQMEFDVILGRTALRKHGILVNPGRSFLLELMKMPAPPSNDQS